MLCLKRSLKISAMLIKVSSYKSQSD